MHNIESDSDDELPSGWEEKPTEDGSVYFVKYVFFFNYKFFAYVTSNLFAYVRGVRQCEKQFNC